MAQEGINMGKPLLGNGTKQVHDLLLMYVAESGTNQSALRDILTDIRHVSKALNLDVEFALDGSEEVFAIEDGSLE